MQGWESSELLVVKGYQKVVGAKIVHVVDETFCTIPTDGANCQYLVCLTSGALAKRCKLAQKGVRWQCIGRLSDA